ncbi:putative phosphoglycerate mutase [Enterobacter sp. BIGb0383]|uniref:histidine phosphatase family protein n=1 Tax=unclassified Enterobacter TaxID=2608935 RepID=UPI000F463E0D|nr:MULTISPECIES: histidine phosphatase family protein [unclassified Enterobacter]ROP62197.1 putative phosphoglycerate mutase [Enterobacter sp. BIGb0383]ROS12358.1 putative phosphoglycerate mutase [Enterobacter sp. BIGb0359]
MKIFLTRHGETQWNACNRLQGQLDSPMTPRGRRQISALCAALEGEGIDSVISSPLGRATEAAGQIAAHLQRPLQFDARLMERCFGILDGKIPEGDDAEAMARIYSGDASFRPEGGESRTDTEERMIASLREMAVTQPGNVCVVSHGHAIQTVIALLSGNKAGEFPRYAHLNGAFSLLEWRNNQLTLVKWGIGTHLLPVMA